MKTLIKWLVVVCGISWAAHNPAQVNADINALMGAGQSLISSVANAGGSALSGVTGGMGGGAPAGPAAPTAPGTAGN
jgi:hypothetical protein